MKPNFDIDYFIAKFEAIPDERWTVGRLTDDEGRHCALGHCGDFYPHPISESWTLQKIFKNGPGCADVVELNDGTQYTGGIELPDTPKARIVTWLKALKEFYK